MSWLAAHREWGAGLHEDGFGIRPSDDVETAEGFSAWVQHLRAEESGDAADASNFRCVYRWIVDDGDLLGGIAFRCGDDDFIRAAGHIGYGIRPSARGRGLATWALGQMLLLAHDLGFARVLLVCEADNMASAATIERNNGELEAVEDTEDGPMRRYWITLPGRSS